MEYAFIPPKQKSTFTPPKQDWFVRLAAKNEQCNGSQLATASSAGETLRDGC